MLLADVAMGWEFQPNRRGLTRFDSAALNAAHHGSDDKGRKYNSISVKGGTCGVLNNEMIVWNTNQVNVRYLCEFGN
jgi:poly [ADP-ribose] polymerase